MGGRDGAISRKSSELDSFVESGGGTVSRLDAVVPDTGRAVTGVLRCEEEARPFVKVVCAVVGLLGGAPLPSDRWELSPNRARLRAHRGLSLETCKRSCAICPSRMRDRAAIFDLKKSALGSGCWMLRRRGSALALSCSAAHSSSSLHPEGLSTPQVGRDLGPGTRSSASPRARHDFCLLDPSSIKVPIEVGQVKEQHNTRSGRGPTRTGVPVVVFVVTRSLPASPQAQRCPQPLVEGAISTKDWATTSGGKLPPPRSQMHPRCPIAASLMQVSICHGHCTV